MTGRGLSLCHDIFLLFGGQLNRPTNSGDKLKNPLLFLSLGTKSCVKGPTEIRFWKSDLMLFGHIISYQQTIATLKFSYWPQF